MKTFRKICSVTVSILEKLFFLMEGFLFLRFILKFLEASPKALIVKIIFRYSDILVSPFNFIFPNFDFRGYFVEISVISAIIGYAILAFIVFKVLHSLLGD